MATRSILISIVILVLAGLPTLFIVGGDEYGVSYDNPLGRFAALDDLLADRGLTRSDRILRADGTVRKFPSHLQVRQYRAADSGGLEDWVLVAAQRDGHVLAVSGTFAAAQDPATAASGGVVPEFMYQFWLRTVGAEPVFSVDRDEDYDHIATDQTTSLIASWQRKVLKSKTVHLVMLRKH